MIAIIKYNAGNIRSVQNALSRLGYKSTLTDDPALIRKAEKVILPGVGEAGSAMTYLRRRKLDTLITSLRQPLLGICLGLQLMCRSSEESNTLCMGIFDAEVKKFPEKDIVPHMGWNNFTRTGGPLLNGIKPEDNMYYVHSYYAETSIETCAAAYYINEFSAVMQKNNFFATQFHPEKSSDKGSVILKNFLEL